MGAYGNDCTLDALPGASSCCSRFAGDNLEGAAVVFADATNSISLARAASNGNSPDHVSKYTRDAALAAVGKAPPMSLEQLDVSASVVFGCGGGGGAHPGW